MMFALLPVMQMFSFVFSILKKIDFFWHIIVYIYKWIGWDIAMPLLVVAIIYFIYHIGYFMRLTRDKLYDLADYIRRTLGARLASYIIRFFSGPLLDDSRQVFRQAYAHMGKPVLASATNKDTSHSHPKAAMVRRSTNNFLTAMPTLLGKKQFSVSSSKQEESLGVDRLRNYYVAKDLQYEYIHKKVKDHHMVTMTDVDYYVKMSDYLQGNTVAISTFIPSRVCGTTEDASYTIDENNQVVMHVNGGGKYVHELWNFETDHLTIDFWWGSVLYLVEKFRFSEDRFVVVFIPIRKVYGPFAWLLPGARLFRRKFVTNGYAHVRYHTIVPKNILQDDLAVRHSIGRLNSFDSVTVTDSLLQTMYTRLRLSKTPQVSDLERLVRNAGDSSISDPVFAATILFDFYKANTNFFAYSYSPISCYAESQDGYQSLKPLVTEDGKAVTRRIMKPICDDGYHPLRSHNNEHAFVDGRIKNVKNLTPTHKIPPRYWVYMSEFVDLLVGHHRGTLTPLSHEEMMVHVANRGPNAVRRVEDENFFSDNSAFIKSFQKAESYGKLTDPRGICTLPVAHNFRLGQFTYPFSEHIMKEQKWYAFGSHPQEIGTRLQDICLNEEKITSSDIAKNDGSVPFFSHCLDNACYTAAYATRYHSEITRMLQGETRTKAVTQTGVKVDIDNMTDSGSSITSDKNSRLNACVGYCALRDESLTKKEAYKKLGLYGGDDGNNRGVSAAAICRAFANIGMLSTAVDIPIFSPVPFLGRIFLNPWATAESVHDVRRALSKIHLASAPATIPDDLILVRKATGFQVTDPLTPLLSNFCAAILRCFKNVNVNKPAAPEVEAILKREVNYFSRFEGPFPTLTSFETAIDVICDNMKCTPDQLEQAIEALDKIERFEEFDSMENFFHREEKVDITVVHRGEVKVGSKDPPADPADSKHQKAVQANKSIAPNLSNIMLQAKTAQATPAPGSKGSQQSAKVEQAPKAPPKTPRGSIEPAKTEAQAIAQANAKNVPPPVKPHTTVVQSAQTGHAYRHIHRCPDCDRDYSHIHPVTDLEQLFWYDCPNPKCIDYHGSQNPKQAVLLERTAGKTTNIPARIDSLMKIMHEATKKGSATSHVNTDVVESADSIVTVTATPSQIVLIKEEKQPAEPIPAFYSSFEADDYYGNAGHESCCRRCGKWSNKQVEDGRCTRYPYCKVSVKPTTTGDMETQSVTIIQNGDGAEKQSDLTTPGHYKADPHFRSVDFNPPAQRTQVLRTGGKQTGKANSQRAQGNAVQAKTKAARYSPQTAKGNPEGGGSAINTRKK